MHSAYTIKQDLKVLEENIKYIFKNRDNLVLALTHSSYANERKAENLASNERLEFLGDAVLNMVISDMIYKKYGSLAEGEMTKARASIVCESSLMKCSNKIDIGKYLLLGKGEELTGGRKRVSILSDAFEALIGAVYIDGGMKKAKAFIKHQMKNTIENSVRGIIHLDYKTLFQEAVQKKSDRKIKYEIIDEKGPDHDKEFVAQVRVSDKVMGAGMGKSKKEAEQNAARVALQKYGKFR